MKIWKSCCKVGELNIPDLFVDNSAKFVPEHFITPMDINLRYVERRSQFYVDSY